MIKINLLPKAEVKKVGKKVEVRLTGDILKKLLIATAIPALLIIVVLAYFEFTKTNIQKDIEKNRKILAELQKKIDEIKKFEVLNKEFERKTKLIEDLKNKQSAPVTLFSTIAKKVPDGVWLTSMGYNEGTISLEGFGFSNFNVVSFVENLKSSPEFQDVNLTESQKSEYEKAPVYKFIINLKLKG